MITTTPERARPVNPLRLYAAALGGQPATMITDGGEHRALPVEVWTGTIGDADRALLRRCSGPTLDLGCGPGRLTTALQATGTLRWASTSPARRSTPRSVAAPSRCAGTCSRRCPRKVAGTRSCWPTTTSGSAATRSGC